MKRLSSAYLVFCMKTDERLCVLLIGCFGQVGWELRRCLAPFSEVVAVDLPDIDLAKPESVRRWVRDSRPQVIINAAAYTAVDKAESNRGLAFAVNCDGPALLAEEAKKLDALLVHYSTDYVYDGSKGEPYVETDQPDPLNVYGQSKLAGDEAVIRSGCRYLIFRCCWVYALRGTNFLLTIQRLAREREMLRVVNDQAGCPTWARMIAESTTTALLKTLSQPDPASLFGVYHLASSTHTTWFGFAKAILSAMSPGECKCRHIEPITSAEYPTPARRPRWSVLSCRKLEKTFGLKLPGWEEGLRLALGG